VEGPAAGDLDEPRVGEDPAEAAGEVKLEEAVRVAPEEQHGLVELLQARGDVEQLLPVDALEDPALARDQMRAVLSQLIRALSV